MALFQRIVWTLIVVFPILYWIIPEYNPWLGDEPFVIGRATADAISVHARISYAYRSIFLFAALTTLVYFFFHRWFFKFLFQIESDFVQSIVPQLILFFIVLNFCGLESSNTVLALYLWLIAQLILAVLNVFHKNGAFVQSETTLGLLALFSVFLFDERLLQFTTFSILFLIFYFIQNRIIQFILFTLIFSFPVLIILSKEISFICAAWFDWYGSVIYFLAYLGVLTGLLSYLLFKQYNGLNWTYLLHLPMLLLGVILLKTVELTSSSNGEMFESASTFNSLFALEKGYFPLIHHISPHLLSDYFWPGLYRFLFGNELSTAGILYVPFNLAVETVLLYFFVRKIIGNHPLLFSFLLFPLLSFYLPSYYAFGCLSLIGLLHFLKVKTLRSGIIFYLTILFTAIWRLDLGLSAIVALGIVHIFIFIYEKELRTKLIQLILLFGLPLLGLLVIFIFQYPTEFQLLKLYFGANQAHGLSRIYTDFTLQVAVDYYLLPVLVVLVLLLVLFNVLNTSKTIRYILIFLGVFYLFNLQRGLVRHSFMEGNETQIASFGWFMVLVLIGLYLKKYKFKQTFSFGLIVLFALPFLCSIHPVLHATNWLEKKTVYQVAQTFNDSITFQNRYTDNTLKNKHKVLRYIQDKCSKKSENFIDCSNQPLLYYYSKKNVPSYYTQFLQNTVHPDAEWMTVQSWNWKNFPIVLLKQEPEQYYDQTDGIPNEVRYQYIHQEILKRYVVDTVIDGNVFLEKRRNIRHSGAIHLLEKETWDLGYIPMYWKPASKKWSFQPNKKVQAHFENDSLCITGGNGPERAGQFLTIQVETLEYQEVELKNDLFSVRFKVIPGLRNYRIPLFQTPLNTENKRLKLHVVHVKTLEIKQLYFEKLVRCN